MRWLAPGFIAVLAGCNGQTNADAGPDGVTSGCTNGQSQTFAVDASACVAQLASTYSCNGAVCSWNVTIPCSTNDAGTDAAFDCNPACAAVDPTSNPAGFCQANTEDGGAISIRCGGCGI